MTERRRRTAYYTHIETRFGPMLVAGDGKRLVAVKFGVASKRVTQAVAELEQELKGAYALAPDDARIVPAARQLRDYLDGKRTAFDVEPDLSWMTPFQRDVLRATARVPRGQVASYAEIARRVGRPHAYRAVGNTMRINPIPIVIPCHRIVGSNRSLTGFGGGLEMKRNLLALEGVSLAI